ncbi:MAG: hypothetical protein LBI92_04345 [Azoarcus sp.]|nr:hypothetical protein [Azoarcus sp.]
MKKFIFFLWLSLLASTQVFACRCLEPEARRAYAEADAVILARIGAVAAPEERSVRIEAEMLRSWKAGVTRNVLLFTAFPETDCAYPMREGDTHLLYLVKHRTDSEAFWTERCMGNLIGKKAAKRIQWLDRHGKKSSG